MKLKLKKLLLLQKTLFAWVMILLSSEAFAQMDRARASFNEFYSNLLNGRCETCTLNHDHSQHRINELSGQMSSIEFKAKEDAFFRNAKAAQVDFLRCQIAQLEGMKKRDVKAMDFQHQVLSDLAEKLPELRIRYQSHLASKAKMDQIEQMSKNLRESQGAAMSLGYADATLKRYQKQYDDELKVYQLEAAKYHTLYASLWRSDDPAMENFVIRQITSTRAPQELFAESLLPATSNRIYQWVTGTREFSFQEQVLDIMEAQAKKDLAILQKAGEPDFSTKKMLVSESEWSQVLSSGDQNDNALLMCKLDKRYVSGDEQVRSHALNAITIAPFGVGVFAKVLSAQKFLRLLTPAMQRAMLANSQTLTTASLYLAAAGVPVVASEIKNACIDDRPGFAYRGPKSCDAFSVQNFHLVERKRVEQENCALAMTMGALIATPPVLKYVGKYRNAGVISRKASPGSAQAQNQARAQQIQKYLDEVDKAPTKLADEPAEIVVTARRPGLDDLLRTHQASGQAKLIVQHRVNPENMADFRFMVQKNPEILRDKAKLNYVLDELTGIQSYTRAQREDVLTSLSATLSRWNPRSVQGRVIALRQQMLDRDMRKSQEWFRRNNPGEDSAYLARLAREEAYLKRQKKLTLRRQCTAKGPTSTAAQSAAGAAFAKKAALFGVGSTAFTFAWANWNDVKDTTWGLRLGHEVVMAAVLSWAGARISSSDASSMTGKLINANIVRFFGSAFDASVYSTFFGGDEDKAKAHLDLIRANPHLQQDLQELNRYLAGRSGVEQLVDEITDVSDNVVRTLTGGKRIQDLSQAEIARLDQQLLQDPIIMERLMDSIGDKIYSDEMGGNTWGNKFIDRLSFDTSWNISPMGAPRGVLAGILTYQAMCRNMDSPVKMLAAFGTIQTANSAIGGYLFYTRKKEAIGQ